MKKSQTVFVGLSGGVDSSVAALRLKKQGYNVVGVFIKVWHPEFMVCNWEAERLDAMRVAAHLEIPFLTCDATAQYKNAVADYFISEYQAGRTPNPDVLCNQEVKFGAFLEFSKKQGADFIATGHYVRKLDTQSKAEMHRGIDDNKDQSYFLWSLSQEQLNQAIFPVGDTAKTQIRKEASAAKIPTAIKKDSQGVCFLGQIDIPEFLSHYMQLTPGAVKNTRGEIIGQHQSALVYTLGQRHGFTINTKSSARTHYYVTARNIEENTITVDDKLPQIDITDDIKIANIVLRTRLASGDQVEAQFRYRQKPFAVEIREVAISTFSVRPLVAVEKPAAGQSCVIYSGSHCLGGGTIL